jgi:RNA polymerase primary sigma factor
MRKTMAKKSNKNKSASWVDSEDEDLKGSGGREIYSGSSNDSVEKYLKSLCQFDLVTVEESKELSLIANTSKNKKKAMEARDKMIVSNTRLVVKCAADFKRKHKTSLEMQDLAEEGIIGLIKAVGKYDPKHESNSRFSTYAVPYIRCEMFKAYKENRFIRIPSHRFELMNAVYRIKYEYIASGETLTDEIILDRLGCSEAMLKAVKIHMMDNVVSLEDIMPSKEGESDSASYWEGAVEDENATSPLETMISSNTLEYLLEVMSEVLSHKEQLTMWNMYLTSEPLKLQDVGDLLGVTRERVRQIKARSLRKLKVYFDEECEENAKELY